MCNFEILRHVPCEIRILDNKSTLMKFTIISDNNEANILYLLIKQLFTSDVFFLIIWNIEKKNC